MNCAVCYRPFENDIQPIKLSCSCTHCVDCMCSWIITQTQELEYQMKEEIFCMEGYCKQPFKVNSVLDQFPISYQDRINTALLNVYLRKTQDIRKCPKDSCNYAGVIDVSSKCEANLECLKCGVEWKEKVICSSTAKKAASKRFCFSFDGSELSSIAWEEFFTKKCPQCNAHIEKNGGCSHMTCKGCGMEFCWYCTQENYSHDNKICWINLTVKLAVVMIFLTHLVLLSGMCEDILEISLKVFNGVLEAFFLDFFLYMICMLSPHNILGKLYTPENKIRVITSLVVFMFFLVVVYVLDAFYSILRMFLFQVGIVGAGLIYMDCFGKWVNSVY